VRVAFLTVVLNIVLNLILSRVMGVNGLALATTISCGLGAVVLAALLRLRLGAFTGGELWRELAKVLAAGALCLGAALILNRIVPGATDKVQTFLRLALITGVSLAIYFAALAAQRVKQLAPLKDMLVERLRGRRA
jgi:putative peptidoglycan lipid II flippase